MSHRDRLVKFRAALSKARLDGFIVNRADMYQGEEVRAADERLAWLTGFTGSAGFCWRGCYSCRDSGCLFG